MIYIPREEGRAGLIARLTDEFSKVEGISKVYTGTELEALGFPVREKRSGARYAAGGEVELQLFTRRGPSAGRADCWAARRTWLFEHRPENGRHICRMGERNQGGSRAERNQEPRCGPTIANILGLKMPSADGRVLREILE